MLELPLLCGPFAGLQEAEAFRCWVGGAQRLACTTGNGPGVDVWLLPEAGAGEEAVLKAGAGRIFKLEVREIEFHGGAGVLVSEIDAGYAFVIGGKSDRDAGCEISWERMPGCVD